MLEKAIRKAGVRGERRQRDPGSVLAKYNLSVVRALEGTVEEALEGFQEVSRDAESLPRRHRQAGCLFMLVRTDGDLSVEEVRDQPDLGELSRSAISVLLP